MVDPEGDEARIGWVNVAVDPDGGAWVLWVRTDGAFVTGMFVARSPGPGEPLERRSRCRSPSRRRSGAPRSRGWPSTAIGSPSRTPAPGSSGTATPRPPGSRWAPATRGRGAFDPAIQVDSLVDGAPFTDADPRTLVVEQARVAFAPDGELWALWKRQILRRVGLGDDCPRVRRVHADRARSHVVHRHDCSPPDFRFGSSGEPLVGLRSNLDGWLQTMAVVIDGGVVRSRQVSDDEWRYNTEICPEDGPRLVELADGTLFAAWMAPSGIAWQLFSAWSTDGGASFTAPSEDHGGVELGERWVAVTATDEGPFFTAVESLDRRTRAPAAGRARRRGDRAVAGRGRRLGSGRRGDRARGRADRRGRARRRARDCGSWTSDGYTGPSGGTMWLVTWLACGGGAPTTPPPEPQPEAARRRQIRTRRTAVIGPHGADDRAPRPAPDRARRRLRRARARLRHGGRDGGRGAVRHALRLLPRGAGKGDGAAGQGLTPPPSDLTDPFHARFYSDAGRVRVIQKGLPGTAMVGFEGVLQPPQIEVYAHVRGLRK